MSDELLLDVVDNDPVLLHQDFKFPQNNPNFS